MMIDSFDWRAAWKEYFDSRRAPDDAEYWNNRAPSFAKTAGTSPYAARFLELAGVQPGETVLDMGAGSGTLALPLADAGNTVVAADFSSVMMDLMMRRAELNGTEELITTKLLAWEDDWDEAEVPVCDVALASRSIATPDLFGALTKLNSRARRRVCLTLSSGVSPRVDAQLLKVVGRPLPAYPEYMYAVNMLWSMGIQPEIRMIESARDGFYNTREEALEKPSAIMELTVDEYARLEDYAAQHLHRTETPEGARWKYDHERVVTWAFISWDK